MLLFFCHTYCLQVVNNHRNPHKKGYTLHTVDIALAECLNIIWKHATLLNDLSTEDIKTATTYLLEVYDRLTVTPTRDLAEQALNIAQTTKTATYDALFIALTQKLSGTLYTADKHLATTAEKKSISSTYKQTNVKVRYLEAIKREKQATKVKPE